MSQATHPPEGGADCGRPLNLIAELTYRCPLGCPYCSNPIDLRGSPEALDAGDYDDLRRMLDLLAALGGPP